ETFLGFVGRPGREIPRPEASGFFFRPGLTWPRRTTSGLSVRALGRGCVIADQGPTAFVDGDDESTLLALLGIMSSDAFFTFVSVHTAAVDAAARSYQVGLVQRTP